MNDVKKAELIRRLSTLSPAKRAWLEQRLDKSVGDRPAGKRRPSVIQLQEGGDKLPVYFIHDGPAEVCVAQMMGAEHPVFGIDVPWPLSWRDAAANNEIAALPTMEQLVAPYVNTMSAHLGSSPCVLVGHSFHGLMAFEAAHQLQRRGGDVKMVMLLDTWSLPPHQVAWRKLRENWTETSNGLEMDRSLHSISSHLSNLWQISWWLLTEEANALWVVFKRLQQVRALWVVFKRLRSAFTATPTDPGKLTSIFDENGMPVYWPLLDRLHSNAMNSYHLRPLNSFGIVFRAEREDERRIFSFYGSLGWENLFTKGLETIPVPGDHITIVRQQPYVLFLGQMMKEMLKRYGTN